MSLILPGSYRREDAGQPPSLYPDYASTVSRSPREPLVRIPHTLTETTGPANAWSRLMGESMADLTTQHKGTPLGQRIVVSGRVVDEDGRPVPHTVVEVWQANAAGRYIHKKDQWDAPLDPNFTGAGRVITDAEGRYRFISVRPGAYPWRNHKNAWRPSHIHLSLLGPAFATRLVTQMYFPGDPLLKQFIDMFPSCDVWPAVPSGGDMRAILDTTMADLYAQKGAAKDALSNAERELQRIHDEYLAQTKR